VSEYFDADFGDSAVPDFPAAAIPIAFSVVTCLEGESC
jgi:hypothetical protein